MKNIFLVAVFFTSMLISSCSSLIVFTDEIRDNLEKNDLDVKKVQFYNSDKIIIKRNLSKEETQIAKSTIKLKNGQYFEEIIIPKHTKGIAIDEEYKYLNIAFESGENRYLRFTLNDDNNYQISADSWKDDYGCINYDTTKYFIVPKSSATILMVNKQYITNYEKNRRVLKGRSVSK